MSRQDRPIKSRGDRGPASPLDIAVRERDKKTLDMVAKALQYKEAMLAFQPVVLGNRPKQPAFYEGLIRVLDATGRIIPAKDFINTIENTEIGRLVDCLSLELGLRNLKIDPSLRISINMSARSIGYKKWLATLEDGLREQPEIAERLILEITESSAMLMPELVTSFMGDMQRKGICFALDDFGAGYTAFRYFRDFFFDIIKIDQQFIQGIHQDADNQVLVSALLSIGKHFDMLTVAEGIESREDALYLIDQGVDCLQGYFFGVPSVKAPWHTEKTKNLHRA
ncbi:EAL domain-containing protein [Algirhabdus cladophorae]|uniref:EAL domain-containing protein n=1 Tax=Algirhabdus cladophorae TaxID=3377108 RepID=UPI003B846321